jgi:hypothetical protein
MKVGQYTALTSAGLRMSGARSRSQKEARPLGENRPGVAKHFVRNPEALMLAPLKIEKKYRG